MSKIIEPEELFQEDEVICNECGCVYEKQVTVTKDRRTIEFWFQCRNCVGYQVCQLLKVSNINEKEETTNTKD